MRRNRSFLLILVKCISVLIFLFIKFRLHNRSLLDLRQWRLIWKKSILKLKQNIHFILHRKYNIRVLWKNTSKCNIHTARNGRKYSLSAVSKPHSHAILRQQCTMYILLISKGITAVKWLDISKPIINYMELIKSLYDDIFNELLICINV